jgi:hypothetical protein
VTHRIDPELYEACKAAAEKIRDGTPLDKSDVQSFVSLRALNDRRLRTVLIAMFAPLAILAGYTLGTGHSARFWAPFACAWALLVLLGFALTPSNLIRNYIERRIRCRICGRKLFGRMRGVIKRNQCPYCSAADPIVGEKQALSKVE